jgi:hypothetical protein
VAREKGRAPERTDLCAADLRGLVAQYLPVQLAAEYSPTVKPREKPKTNKNMKNEIIELSETELSVVSGGGEYAALGMWWGGGGAALTAVGGVAASAVVVAGGIAASPILAAAAGVGIIGGLAFAAFGGMVSYMDGLKS